MKPVDYLKLVTYANEGRIEEYTEGKTRKYIFRLELSKMGYDTLREVVRILKNVDDFVINIKLEVDEDAGEQD